jgi:hypothetical protein
MCPTSAERVIKLHLNGWHGDQNAREELIPLLCAELRRLARRYLWLERPDRAFQNGGPVHAPCLRPLHEGPPQWQSRAHFSGIAANTQLMREILVDRARSPLPAKRGAVARAWLQRELKQKEASK